MPAILTVITEQDVRDYLAGRLPPVQRAAMERTIAEDPDTGQAVRRVRRALARRTSCQSTDG